MSISKKLYLLVSCAAMISMTSFCSENEGQQEPQVTQQPDLREQLENPRKKSWSRDCVEYAKETVNGYIPFTPSTETTIGGAFVAGGCIGGFNDKTVGRFKGSLKGLTRNSFILGAAAVAAWKYNEILDTIDAYKKEVDKTHATKSH